MAAGGLRLLRQVATGKTGLGAIFQTLSTNILMQGLNIATGVVTPESWRRKAVASWRR
jgi:hypothetical protein